MFNETKIKQLSQLIDLDDLELLEIGLKKQSSYLGINSTYLLKSFIVLVELKREYENKKLEIDNYHTKNLKIQKYKSEIIELYTKEKFGYLKISKYLMLNHKCSISKSSIENFIKKNGISKCQI